jgi:hypothetical protein
MNDPTQTPGPVLTVPGAPLAFQVMAKPTGAVGLDFFRRSLDLEHKYAAPWSRPRGSARSGRTSSVP